MIETGKLWKLLWDYDPNALLVLDERMTVKLVNAAFLKMFRVSESQVIGRPAADFIADISDFETAYRENREVVGQELEIVDLNLYVRKVIFPIRDEKVVACIMVDMTREWEQRQEMARLKRETLAKVSMVVDKQMQTAQEVAGLLGETTAETKVSLIKLLEMFRDEIENE